MSRTNKEVKESLSKEVAKIPNGRLFSKVRVAREVLRERAEELINEYLDIASKAKDSGDYQTAAKAMQWLIEHLPADEDGTRVVETGVDKQQQQVVQQAPPQVRVGIVVGGIGGKQLPKPKPKEITAEVIDAE